MATQKIPFVPEDAQFLATAFPQYLKINGAEYPVSVLAYDSGTKESGFWKFKAVNYGSGNLTVVIRWTSDTATSGDVVWGAAIARIPPDSSSQDITTKTLATPATVTDSHLGTTVRREMSCSITITSLDSIAANDTVWIVIYRDGGAGGDTMACDAFFIEASLEYSDT